MARPTKYSNELAQAICETISKGIPLTFACHVAGIDRSTLRRWRKENATLCLAIKRAAANALAVRIERIQRAAKGGEELERKTTTITRKDGTMEETSIVKRSSPQWQADAWWLERQCCEEFGLNRLDLKELIRDVKELNNQRKTSAGRN